MKILIGGDIVPTETNEKLFEDGNASALLGKELLAELEASDLNIFNLEVPLADQVAPILKCGPCLISRGGTAYGLNALHAHFVTLANNHIMDQGRQGLLSTFNSLKKVGISFAGAGETIADAKKPFVIEISKKRIGVYCCAEREFSIADESTCGANPFDPLESFDEVHKLRSECDFVIILYHGGKEHYRYPSPYLQKVCRKLVDAGANLIVCQHSHCIGCKEEYNGGTIVYGQGNFLFDYMDNEFWKSGLLISIDENFAISYLPVVKEGNSVRIATEEKDEILHEFEIRSNQIKDTQFVLEEYRKFSERMIGEYLAIFTGKAHRLSFRVLNKLTRGWWCRSFDKRRTLLYKLAVLNFVECEAHRELLISGLKESCRLYFEKGRI